MTVDNIAITNRLSQLEATISRGLQSFYEVGAALAEIRDSRLYRANYATFDSYLRERWGMGRHRAYQLINATEVVNSITIDIQAVNHGQQNLPTNERQTRALTSVPPARRAEVWKAATKSNAQPTARQIKAIANQVNSAGNPFETPIGDGGATEDGRNPFSENYREDNAEAERQLPRSFASQGEQGKSDSIESDLNQTLSRIQSLEKENAELNTRIRELEQENSSLLNEVDSLRAQLANLAPKPKPNINIIKPQSCPHCGSNRAPINKGMRGDRVSYKCRDCNNPYSADLQGNNIKFNPCKI